MKIYILCLILGKWWRWLTRKSVKMKSSASGIFKWLKNCHLWYLIYIIHVKNWKWFMLNN